MIRESVPSDYMITLHPKNIEEIGQYTEDFYKRAVVILAQYSAERWTITDKKGKILSIAGVAKNEKGRYDIWLLFADIEKIPLSFYKETYKKTREIVKKYGTLDGSVYIKNTFALEWAKFIGAKVSEPAPKGLYNNLFYDFVIKE